jgi:hypothetical protein
MLRRQATLDQLKQQLRTEICPTCPFRAPRTDDSGMGTPLPCEAKCPVFVHLPILKAVGERIDPMIGSHERAVESTIRKILANACETDASASDEPDDNRLRRLRYHQKNLSKILGRLLNP